MICRSCRKVITAESLWCPECGTWAAESRTVCECERGDQGKGACVVCGTPVCDSCGIESGGMLYCTDATHPAVHRSHVVLGTFVSVFEADWVCKNLEAAGVRTVRFDLRSRPAYYGMTLPYDVIVLVPAGDLTKAREILSVYEEPKGT